MTVYALVLGPQGMSALAPACRALHQGYGRFEGRITVEVTRNPILRLLLRLAGFPKAADEADLVFVTAKHGQSDRWERHVAGQVMRSALWAQGEGWLAERMGPVVALSRPVVRDGGLELTGWRFRALGVPLPGWLSPRVAAREWPEAGRYSFDIEIRAPWGGLLVRYRGWLGTIQDPDQGG